jgi:hypothetical protein
VESDAGGADIGIGAYLAKLFDFLESFSMRKGDTVAKRNEEASAIRM